ncbi:Structure-specific endonuclease subunit SLX1 like [Pseudolycoriella hygida]|uniref:Structure-specific endonuclease subunit SLX1 like n=1 Tax=Pseudolycoriella hygida TaxID=35572 RepID=A0A9Q0RWN9_9DIPT|nr:Structure-specific endonuclease subunit SLX1 like [Pseudolycoriella hygida]
MVMIIHGFPNNISALQFEWAWQHPTESRRLKVFPDIQRRKPRESHFDYNFRVLAVMLQIGPWKRLPLTIRWISADYCRDFPIGKTPPVHMPICHGRVKIKKIPKSSDSGISDAMKMGIFCRICYEYIKPDNSVACISPSCRFVGHLKCLAKLWLEPGEYVPIQGSCVSCKKTLLWGDLIRKKNGCSDLENCVEFEDDDGGSFDIS